MKTAQIKSWLRYWQTAQMVAINEIKSLEDVALARRYCSCIRLGVFADVSDAAIWQAISEDRAEGRFLRPTKRGEAA